MQAILGHDGPPQNLWRENLLTDAPLAECPMRTVIRAHETRFDLAFELDRHMRYYNAYDRGAMLVDGGVADQPARYTELMELIDRQKNETDSKYLELVRKEGEDDAANAPPPHHQRYDD